MRIFANANFDFLGGRHIARVVSGAALALAVSAIVFWSFASPGPSWVNFGVDFLGGTLVQVKTPAGTTVDDLRETVAPVASGATVTRFGGEYEFLIRAPEFAEEGEGGANVSDLIIAAVQERLGAEQVEVVRTEAVGAKVGEELQQKAALAILFSFGLTLIYLAFRFEWRFGVAAIIAAVHDILVTLGFISLFRLDVSLPTVAAVLTIIGYSLNDTIVVFDRIRENLKKLGRREEHVRIMNRSINEVLPRTVMTSGTTLVALLSLFVFGGAVIREFALILIFGIVVGTYSSIFVAAPALLAIQQRWPKVHKKPGGTRPKRERAEAAV